MEQTLAEKLRILADATEAGEAHVQVGNDLLLIPTAVYYLEQEQFSRILLKPTIKVGNREINAPLRAMPNEGDRYWIIDRIGGVAPAIANRNSYHKENFLAANCWATKEDAEAYRDASLAVRKGKV